MQILVNGDTRTIGEGADLAAFIDAEGLAGRRLAVELNGAIVPRSAWADTPLADGDRLEIVHAIGGG